MASSKQSVKSHRKWNSIRTALASAVLEWLLICMLFVDAILSCLITKFACYCQLQTPCLLCSRLDHILGNKKLKYYWDLICGVHKSEISSLVLCHAHNNLVDVHGICERCLFSFATTNKTNAETYRLLVGKLGGDSSLRLNEDPLLEDHVSSTRHCSCCNEPWVPRVYSEKLMQTKAAGSEAANFDVLLSGGVRNYKGSLKEIEQSVSVRDTHQRINSGLDHLSRIGYTELNVNSDTESDAVFSDDDDNNASAQSREINPREDVAVGCPQKEDEIITLPDDLASENLTEAVTPPPIATSVSPVQSDFIKPHDVTSISPTAVIAQGSEELHWQQADVKCNPSVLPDLISLSESPPSIAKDMPVEVSREKKDNSLDDVPPSFDVEETIVEESEESVLISVASSSYARGTPVETSERSEHISIDAILPSSESKENPAQVSIENKLVSTIHVLPLSSAVETPVQGLRDSCIARTEEVWQAAVTDCEEMTRTESSTMAGTVSETNPVSSDGGPQVPNLLDLGEAYKLAVGSRGRQLSGVLAEQWIGKDSSRVSDDLKLLFSQLSAAREQLTNDTSPRVTMSPRVSVSPKLSINSDELKNPDASSAIGMQILQKRISLERNESGLSLDGSIVSEIEGETVVDRLNRQIEHDKKLLIALYKELEEERNASAIAANQAMAMITRLQEEKATLQMEALQCLRMMEEQAEYDMETLQKTNDLLAEREKEIQDLEADLEFYRNNYQSESLLQDTIEQNDIKEEHPEASSVKISTKTRKSVTEKQDISYNVEGINMSAGDKSRDTLKNSLLDFEDESSDILHCLKKLEKRLCLFSNNQLDFANSEYSGNTEEKVNNFKGMNGKLEFQLNNGAEENELLTQNVRVNGPALSGEVSELTGDENNEIFYSGQSFALPTGEIDLDSLANEVSDLNERLKALEADRIFLEHSMNSIRGGQEGVQFVQEIAFHLKELRRIGIRKEEQKTS
ncbi:hypothetical protein JCGZ_23521 [Jatropha curcas]|uniref:GTD-binding domain-containing protein n=1 Tax=Jatropha curcas TaxID=180498 RepID=A0A067JLJ9_JATCU|nr:hypothetical protein JCGZ_23521 [Jatropha curcas]